MAVQDLTPQLRTRLSRLEKAVGWFVTLATLLLFAGLAYYLYKMAETKGWLKTKAPYFTYLKTGMGVKPGDKVRLMGFEVGEVSVVEAEKPESGENVYVEFRIFEPYYGYIWDDSFVLVRSAGFLGARYLEVTKGGTTGATNLHATFKEENRRLVAAWSRETLEFTNWNKGSPYELYADEPPELSSQLDQTVQMLKVSLTNILQLTNSLAKILTSAADATANANDLLREAKPIVANAAEITSNLKDPRGALGEWLIPMAMNYQLTSLLTNANSTMTNVNLTVGSANATVINANTNLVMVFSNITEMLENLAGITGNLHAQVQRNNNMLTSISRLIVDTDDMVQGLKRHWLLRSAFKDKDEGKSKSNAPNSKPEPRPSPKGAGRE